MRLKKFDSAGSWLTALELNFKLPAPIGLPSRAAQAIIESMDNFLRPLPAGDALKATTPSFVRALRPNMHALHPRSRSTSTLFTTTLAVSFLVVALPHLLPCPVDRRQSADSFDEDGKTRRRKKRVASSDDGAQMVKMEDEDGRRQRECPVPKPGGLVGQMMGFEQKSRDSPRQVVVQDVKAARLRSSGEHNQNDAP